MTAYGIKKPKPKTKKQIERYLDKKEIDKSAVYSLTVDGVKEVFNDLGGLPRMLIFNKEGEYIPYVSPGDTSTCIGDAQDFFKDLDANKTYTVSDERTLESTMKELRTLDGEVVLMDNLPKADFYVLAYWATYMGRMNKENLREWIADEEANDKSDVHILKVSCDFQTWWKEEDLAKFE